MKYFAFQKNNCVFIVTLENNTVTIYEKIAPNFYHVIESYKEENNNLIPLCDHDIIPNPLGCKMATDYFDKLKETLSEQGVICNDLPTLSTENLLCC